MRFASLVFAAAALVPPICTASPPVKVELRTSWARHPYLVEILETLSLEDPHSFFPVLNALADSEWSTLEDATDEQTYSKVLEVALAEGRLAQPGELASVNMLLALHSANPRIESAYQYYTDNHNETGRLCESWVDWYGAVVCDRDTLRELVQMEAIEGSEVQAGNSSYPHPTLLPFDHVNPSPESVLDRPPRTAVLYASLASPNFRELHEYLRDASSAATPHVEYVLRHVPPQDHASNSVRTFLSGYGVALDLKKMDYLALDDRRQGSSGADSSDKESSTSAAEPDAIAVLIQQYPDDATTEYTAPLTSEEMVEVGVQSTQLIGDAEDTLAALRLLSQNFPKYATSIARRVTVNEGLSEEVEENAGKVQGGINAVWLNGAQLTDDNMNPFSLLRIMRKERATMLSLISLGLSEAQAIELLTHRAVGLAQSDSGALDGIFDASDRPERGGVVVYWNDIENDVKYSRWNPSINTLLQPMYPGQLPNAKLNIWNVVFALDLSTPTGLNVIGGPINAIISRGFPFRLGVVPLLTDDASTKMARLLYWLVDQLGTDKTLSWFFKVSRQHIENGELTSLNWGVISAEFGRLIEENDSVLPEDLAVDFAQITAGEDEDLERRLEKARAYAKRLNLDPAEAPQGHFFVNGKHFALDDNFMRSVQSITSQQLQHVQEQLYYGNLSEEDVESMSTYFYDRPEASRRRNKHVYPSSKPGSLRIDSLVELVEKSGLPFMPSSFVYPPESERVPMTTIVVADLDSAEGLQFVREALLSMKENSIGRVTFVHNPSTTDGLAHPVSSLFAHLIVKRTLAQVPPTTLLKVFGLEDVDASGAPTEQTVLSSLPTTDKIVVNAEQQLGDVLDGVSLSSTDDDEVYASFAISSRYAVRELKLRPGEQAVVVNGRIIGSLSPGDLIAEDIEQLLAYEHRKRVGPVVEALEDVVPSLKLYNRDAFAQAVSLASSVISSIHLPDASEVGLFNAPLKPRRRNYQLLGGKHTKFEFNKNSTALLHFGVLLDPVSEAAQKWSSLLEWLVQDPAVYVELHLNPGRFEELPLKRFYRYNLQPTPRFDEQGLVASPRVVFEALPEEPIYTLAMDIAPSWLVRPREATYDLDNILLSALSKNERAQGVYALFDLDFLVIEGHAREGQTLSPPRGLQLQLVPSTAAANSTEAKPIADTLVVANLGYLQFRAKPGVFRLEIRPGRGRDIFAIESVGGEGWESPSVAEAGDAITLMSFEGLTLYPRMQRLPGMEEADVLESEGGGHVEEEGLVGKLKTGLSSLFSSKQQADVVPATADGEAEINIFTVASGLLYERFASIMILSVLRNTKSTVKFWFIENFLSPSFLEFIPHFAQEYGFQYELVTYKWPSWLRPQKEKQRTIWGYKILFLDVLFPMSLKRVIFVDADQIVRADLRELVGLDLHGAPYAYTPMGDDNTDMEGFRFWKTGYWKQFLGPLKYHISALYVVDLVRFRQMAAGDMLRAQYQGLSADPNSLANLDQDLPNNLQREVPIYSLHEDWLWCETWCSKDRLDRAKTIDLCQNPLTKEPKLERAKHIPEWESYDAEIARFARSLAERGVIHSGMADADATKLAEVGSAKTMHEDEGKSEKEREEGRPRDEL